jgi:hypothetical protein
MDLKKISKELDVISKELAKWLPVLKEAEFTYNKVYFKSLLESGLGNKETREAAAWQTCEAEGVLQPFEEAKIEVRTLLNRKECLIEIAKNTRMMRGQDK